MRRTRADRVVEPHLITSAPERGDLEFDRRRRHYLEMMALRVVCVVGAALTYRWSVWVAMLFILGGAVLPWCAVIIANDRPAKKRAKRPDAARYAPERALPGSSDTTIDG
jgi:hypothetical protein